MSGAIGNGIFGLIVVLIASIVIFIVWPFQQVAADKYLLLYHDRCEVPGMAPFTTLFVELDPNSPDLILRTAKSIKIAAKSTTDTQCQAPAVTGLTADKAYTSWPPTGDGVAFATQTVVSATEHGEQGPSVTAASASSTAATDITNGVWKSPLTLLAKYSVLNRLLISISTIISVASFFVIAGGRSFISFRSGNMGLSGIQMSVVAPILALVLIIAQLLVAPFLMEFADGAYYWLTAGRLTIFVRWGGISELIFGFFPVIYNGSLLAWLGVMAYTTFSAFRGEREMREYY